MYFVRSVTKEETLINWGIIDVFLELNSSSIQTGIGTEQSGKEKEGKKRQETNY